MAAILAWFVHYDSPADKKQRYAVYAICILAQIFDRWPPAMRSRQSRHRSERPSARAENRNDIRFEKDQTGRPPSALPATGMDSGETGRVYGLNSVLEVLQAGNRQIEELIVVEGARDSRVRELLDLARTLKIPVRRVPRDQLARIAPGATHQGVVATVAAARYADADALIDRLSARVQTENPPLAVVLDGLEDPRNLGAVLRTVDCAGADAVFIPDRRAVGLTDVVAKSAAGALEYVPVARVTNLVRLIDELKARNIWVVGTDADASLEYTDWDWKQPSVVVLGSEGSGLHRLVKEHCDTLVRIPVLGHLESLNVSVAAGVILYEALRQRRKPTPDGVS
jgi:23S rRNA (guanosine2251-2'-O)-methyltransferase